MSPCTKMLLDLTLKYKKEGLKEGKKEGLKEGKKEGLKEGKIEGMKEAILNTTRKMIEKNMETKEIQDITGLSKEEIENLSENM